MKINCGPCLLVTALVAPPFILLSAISPQKNGGRYLTYVGTYTTGKSKGIYAYWFDTHTGTLSPIGLAAESVNPSFLAVHPSGRFLYAVNEIGNYQGQKSGGVSAFAINRQNGKLAFLNELASRGADPCHLSFDRTGKFVLVANYTGGSLAVFPIIEGARLGEASTFIQNTGKSVNPERQEGPHAHAIETSPDNRYALAADLGLDRLLVSRFNPANGSLQPNDPAYAAIHPGAGPRHFAFHPNGRFVYVVNEMGASLTAFSYDPARGALREIGTVSTLPKGFSGQSDGAEIEVHPSGKFLYTSNRGHDSIAVFAIDANTGGVTPVEYAPTQGKTPRHFAIDPSGSYLLVANQDSNNLVTFQIDQRTGRLTAQPNPVEAPSPICIVFVRTE